MKILRTGVVAMTLILLPALATPHPAQTNGNPTPDRGKANVAVFLYDGALLLDYGIAAEMFLAADFMRAFNVFTVARDSEVNLSIVGRAPVDYTLDDAPPADVIIVPGGPTWPQEAGKPETVSYLKSALDSGSVLFSICTGGMLLAKAGLLEERKATTNHQAAAMMKKVSPSTRVETEADYVDDGNVVTAAGAGTAIEATLHVVERLTTRAIADDLAKRYLDYPYRE